MAAWRPRATATCDRRVLTAERDGRVSVVCERHVRAAQVAWLLNVRGEDVPHCPVLQAYAIVHATEERGCDLFVDVAKVATAVAAARCAVTAVKPPLGRRA